MLKLSDINAMVAHHVRRDDFDITTADRIPLTNFVHRRFVALTNWDDYTQISTRMTSLAATATYTWAPGPTFQDILGLFLQDGDDANAYKQIMPARSILTHYANLAKPAGFPETYRFYRLVDETKIIEFAPAPKYASKIIRVDGIIEPALFTDGEESTLFSIAGIDDAFALTLAAFFASRDGANARSEQLFAWAGENIKLNTGKEIRPEEFMEALRL